MLAKRFTSRLLKRARMPQNTAGAGYAGHANTIFMRVTNAHFISMAVSKAQLHISPRHDCFSLSPQALKRVSRVQSVLLHFMPAWPLC